MKTSGREFFNTSLLETFGAKINSSYIFYKMPEYKHLWNLICVLMDRLDSSVRYLNKHINHPTNENDLILFLVHATILKDGIYKFHENVYKTKPETTEFKKWFTNVHDCSGPIFNDTNRPTDDVFFEYLRAMAFAHPFEVTKRGCRPFIDGDEIHYSPWVITNSFIPFEEDDVGLQVYTSKVNESKSIFFSFRNLKHYLRERYLLLEKFIDWGTNEIFRQNKKWLETKVERSDSVLTTLNNVCKIMDERCVSHYSIDEALAITKTSFDYEPNKSILEHVKREIEQKVPRICDCVDALYYDGIDDLLDFLYERPYGLHDHASYELEKIFEYLEDERGESLPGSNEEWGLMQAVNFYNSYAKRFVLIDFEKMNYLQIKVLIRLALIVGREKEKEQSQTKQEKDQ